MLPPYAAADSKLQDPPSLAAQGKKEEREEGKKEVTERCRETQTERHREHGSVLGQAEGEVGGGRKSLARKTKQFAKRRNKYSWLNPNPTGFHGQCEEINSYQRQKGSRGIEHISASHKRKITSCYNHLDYASLLSPAV